MKQQQFLNVVDRDVADAKFRAALQWAPLAAETISLATARGRVLAAEVVAQNNVPAFDRSNFDGFAVCAADTQGAMEASPRTIRLLDQTLTPGRLPTCDLQPGEAIAIATGAVVPRGADAVVMVEDTDLSGHQLQVYRAVAPGFGVTFAGTDIARGEIVLGAGQLLSSRETGVLAAIGCHQVDVVRRPVVGIISTGDEIVAPGAVLEPGQVYDSNAQILADAVTEVGGVPKVWGIVADDLNALRRYVKESLVACDMTVLSGGTSKGAGDISYRAVSKLTDPGILVHGVALKPGKPICLAAHHGKAVVVLPGFPTSAIFTFFEFVAPVIRRLAGRRESEDRRVSARMAVKTNSQVGRTEYVLVGLVRRPSEGEGDPVFSAYPLGKGSGSVTTFSHADGYVTVDRHCEIVEQDQEVEVRLLDRQMQLADLIVIGSHCVGLDFLLSRLRGEHWQTKFLAVGSHGGLEAALRGECDLAGIHLLDEDTNAYNRPFLKPGLVLVPGYERVQGLVCRRDDARLADLPWEKLPDQLMLDPQIVMVNRNRGSGTRVLIDRLLGGVKPRGYPYQVRSHHAVAAAIEQGRADWGLATEWVARQAGLAFRPLTTEQYDFVVPESRIDRPAVRQFCALLDDSPVVARLQQLGCSRPG